MSTTSCDVRTFLFLEINESVTPPVYTYICVSIYLYCIWGNVRHTHYADMYRVYSLSVDFVIAGVYVCVRM